MSETSDREAAWRKWALEQALLWAQIAGDEPTIDDVLSAARAFYDYVTKEGTPANG